MKQEESEPHPKLNYKHISPYGEKSLPDIWFHLYYSLVNNYVNAIRV